MFCVGCNQEQEARYIYRGNSLCQGCFEWARYYESVPQPYHFTEWTTRVEEQVDRQYSKPKYPEPVNLN